MAPKADNSSLSERDMEHLRNYLRCFKTKPEIDYEKFAALSGAGNLASARATLGRLLSKVSAHDEAASTPSPTKGGAEEEAAPETPVTGKKKSAGRKRKGDAAEGETAETPTKKKKSTPAKSKGKTPASATKLEHDSSPIKEDIDEAAGDDT